MAIFPGEPGLASFTEAKDGGSGGDNWSCKSCKTPVKSSSPTNQHRTFYRPDALPVIQPTVSKYCSEMRALTGSDTYKWTYGVFVELVTDAVGLNNHLHQLIVIIAISSGVGCCRCHYCTARPGYVVNVLSQTHQETRTTR